MENSQKSNPNMQYSDLFAPSDAVSSPNAPEILFLIRMIQCLAFLDSAALVLFCAVLSTSLTLSSSIQIKGQQHTLVIHRKRTFYRCRFFPLHLFCCRPTHYVTPRKKHEHCLYEAYDLILKLNGKFASSKTLCSSSSTSFSHSVTSLPLQSILLQRTPIRQCICIEYKLYIVPDILASLELSQAYGTVTFKS